MATTIDFRFWVARMRHVSGEQVTAPLLLPEVARVDTPAAVMAEDFRTAFQSTYLQKGRHLELLHQAGPETIEPLDLEVPLRPGRKGLAYPELTLRLDVRNEAVRVAGTGDS